MTSPALAWFAVDWAGAFVPRLPVELVLRGSLVYLALFALLRAVLKREAGALGISDLLVLVLVADAAQNAMTAEYTSLPDGLALVGTIVFWNYALDWLAHRSPRFRRLARPQPLPLVRDGRLLRHNLRRELITEEELMGQLRLQGCDDVAAVRAAYLEGDGRISVVQRDGAGGGGAPEPLVR